MTMILNNETAVKLYLWIEFQSETGSDYCTTNFKNIEKSLQNGFRQLYPKSATAKTF